MERPELQEWDCQPQWHHSGWHVIRSGLIKTMMGSLSIFGWFSTKVNMSLLNDTDSPRIYHFFGLAQTNSDSSQRKGESEGFPAQAEGHGLHDGNHILIPPGQEVDGVYIDGIRGEHTVWCAVGGALGKCVTGPQGHQLMASFAYSCFCDLTAISRMILMRFSNHLFTYM